MTTELLGGQLRQWRDSVGLSRRALAEAAGCSDESVRKYEAGTRTPSLGQLLAICTALAEVGRIRRDYVSANLELTISSPDELAKEALGTQLRYWERV
jgi:transcriptional regulator with XRE-family HTH domain